MDCRLTNRIFKLFNRQKKKRKSIDRFERPPSYSKVVPSFDPPPSYFGIIGTTVPKTGEEANSICISIENKKKCSSGIQKKQLCLPELRTIPNALEDDDTHMLLMFSRRRTTDIHDSHCTPPFPQTTLRGLNRISEVYNLSPQTPQPPELPEQATDWRTSLLWIVQYSLKSTLQATIDHFKSVLSRAMLLLYTTRSSFQISEVECQKPVMLSAHRWRDFIRAVGFKVEGPGTDTDMQRTFLVITEKVTRSVVQRLTKLLHNMSGLPYEVLHVLSQLSPEEGKDTHKFLYHFYGLQDGDSWVISTHDLLRNVWHRHRRPWLLLQNLGFKEIHSNHKAYVTVRDDSFKLLNNVRTTLEVLWILFLERE
ncbi:uncharacterized protein LOC117118239 isoform X2 [Anneissia japonica]|uniref:uncharacterized protein LOC117118239 isoform X2 n=1 Tax=Anneissia japonica TaxID=1529436 RepID=UPI0014257273|nr:uncharacterized protein LOC117118239 isoform X2 [Anneissia japonica]